MTPSSYWTIGEFATVPPALGSVPVDRDSPPSSYAVASLLEGEPGAFARLIGVTAIRSLFIVPGVWLGAKISGVEASWLRLAAMGGCASVTISLGMLAWYALQRAAGRPAPIMDGRR